MTVNPGAVIGRLKAGRIIPCCSIAGAGPSRHWMPSLKWLREKAEGSSSFLLVEPGRSTWTVAKRLWKLAGDKVPGSFAPQVFVPAGTVEKPFRNQSVSSVHSGRRSQWMHFPARRAGLISIVAPRPPNCFSEMLPIINVEEPSLRKAAKSGQNAAGRNLTPAPGNTGFSRQRDGTAVVLPRERGVPFQNPHPNSW